MITTVAVAALKNASLALVAVMVQVPAFRTVTVLPVTEQIAELASVTE